MEIETSEQRTPWSSVTRERFAGRRIGMGEGEREREPCSFAHEHHPISIRVFLRETVSGRPPGQHFITFGIREAIERANRESKNRSDRVRASTLIRKFGIR